MALNPADRKVLKTALEMSSVANEPLNSEAVRSKVGDLNEDDFYDSLEIMEGGGLVESCLAQAKEAGVAYALLYSAAVDVRSILRFYERHSFRSWNVQMFRKL